MKEGKMKIDELTLGELKELQSFVKKGKQKEIKDGGIRICILQRGWVVVGRYSQKGSECKLTDASVVRVWGTTKGLGELAMSGPIPDKTKLDQCPDVYFHELVGVFQIQCEASKWETKLRA